KAITRFVQGAVRLTKHWKLPHSFLLRTWRVRPTPYNCFGSISWWPLLWKKIPGHSGLSSMPITSMSFKHERNRIMLENQWQLDRWFIVTKPISLLGYYNLLLQDKYQV